LIVRLLLQTATWFVTALATAFLLGPLLRRTHLVISIAWMVFMLGLGDAIAALFFGRWPEILALTLLPVAVGALLYRRFRDWNALGQVAWLSAIIVVPFFLAYGFSIAFTYPLQPLSFLIVLTFFFIQMAASLMTLTHVFENLEISCRVRWPRRTGSIPPAPGFEPMVSLHLPAYNEPPEIVAQTLRALAELEYPNFEVIVVDNNTPEEKTWRPVEALCRELGPRFHFYHVDHWLGYKAGALNFALARTDPAAELVGVIDADYRTDPDFLRQTVPAFTNPKLAFIQAPQDYRDFVRGSWSEAIYNSYEYFFEIPMPVRNERNAIIFAGTMGLIRKRVLQEVGGWSEWCITEDAELSLRVLKKGYESIYLHRSMGKGLMPCNFSGLKRQRFRWCFGNIQILRRHWESLMPWAHRLDPENKLTAAQRYFYLAGCMQWFTDAFNILFGGFLFAGGLVKLFTGNFTIVPVTEPLIILAAIFTVLNIWRFGWVLRNALRLSWGTAFRSMYAMFSVGWVVALASFRGMIQKHTAFLRTPKGHADTPTLNALFDTRWEDGIGILSLVLGIGVLGFTDTSANAILVGCLLLWQASLYLAAPVYSLFYKSCTE
jgi:cellulose synthase/poly-beta-1,6-N-acetylglucosamine synthase-like glycosyltransferase